MQLSLRAKFLLLLLLLLSIAVFGLSAFFLSLYREDKLAAFFGNERASIARFGEHFRSVATLARVVPLEEIKDSRDVILVADSPCSGEVKPVLSRSYEAQFKELELDPSAWLNSLEMYKACQEAQAGKSGLRVLPAAIRIGVPYLALFFSDVKTSRLALVSMEGLQTTPASTLFILDAGGAGKGAIVWSEDSSQFLDRAIQDTGVALSELVTGAERALASGEASVARAGRDGLVSLTPVWKDGEEGWAMVSLSYYPMMIRPVVYAFQQFAFLAVGIFALVIVIARNAANLVTRPLSELRAYCDRIGAGDFKAQFAGLNDGPASARTLASEDEIVLVKRTFNVMVAKIQRLLEDVKKNADLQAELRVAKQVQRLLLPPAAVQATSVQISSVVQYAAQCGGDWWGCHETQGSDGNPRIFVLMGDATDHGVSSALMTAVVRGGMSVIADWIRDNRAQAEDPRWILERLNRALFDSAQGSITMTFFAAVIDPVGKKVLCASAAHPFPYLMNVDPLTRKAQLAAVNTGPGISLGESPRTRFESSVTLEWGPGSRLFIYSDGLIDALKGQDNLFGRKDLRRALLANATASGPVMLNRIGESRQKVAKDLVQADDISMVICDAK